MSAWQAVHDIEFAAHDPNEQAIASFVRQADERSRVESVQRQVLQCVAGCCSVSQCVAVCRSAFAMCCSVLQCGAVWCSVFVVSCRSRVESVQRQVLQCIAMCCSVL